MGWSPIKKVNRLRADEDGLTSMKFVDGGKRQSATYTWYRGEHCNFGPTRSHLQDWQGYKDYFITGYSPTEPFITTDTKITAFGSCFAANISKWLMRSQYKVLNQNEKSNAYIVRMGEGLVTSHAILQQFQWAFENKQPEAELWHGYDATSFGYDPTIRAETLEIFSDTDLFILTFGLSEVWYDKITDEVFWRAVPRDKFNPERHGFRIVTPDENYKNIREIVCLIQKYRPQAKIIMTLSPIPLVATFRPISCTSANSVSKASLRIALDRVIEEFRGQGVYYWPSYEIVMDGFLHKWEPDGRHVKRPILDFIMTLFESVWCAGRVTDRRLARALLNAKVVDGSIKRSRLRKIKALEAKEFEALIATYQATGRDRWAKTLLQAYGEGD